jgi:RimJ/RimL family protein N-acetyltransferase
MIYEITQKQFIDNILNITGVVFTSLINDIINFESSFYVDEQNNYYLSIDYGGGEVVTVFRLYNHELYEKILRDFPNAVSIDFIFNNHIKRKDLGISNNYGINYHYKLQRDLISTDGQLLIKLISENDMDLLKMYENMYQQSFRLNHGFRLTNYWKNNAANLINDKERLYLAFVGDLPVGLVISNIYHDYRACDVADIVIEEVHQKKGFGVELLSKVTHDILKLEYDVYYSSVNDDSVASQKTAEKVGYSIVASRISVNVE